MKNVMFAVCFLLVLAVVGCQYESPAESPAGQAKTSSAVEISPAKDDPKAVSLEVTDPKARAIAAKEALVGRLSEKLVLAMSTKGPAAAIEVCSKEATKIAKSVGKKHGVRIGRTSLKLRNPKNEPPAWVKPLIEDAPAEPQVVDLPEGHTGVLLPIKLQAKCLSCHGPTDQIPDAILSQLAVHYPNDQATGFQADDLRGWFWVEVPSP